MAADTHAYELLFDEDGVRADLRVCRGRDSHAFNHVIVMLGELRGNPSLAENFVMPGFQDATIEDVRWIESLQREGINASRTKLWEVRKWRLIFFADHRTRRAALVAVMHRGQDYERDKALWARLRKAYERLGFDRI
ncbi:MAG TPA: hypothetical protein VF759_11420 [Allosphingosinicella sp.]|jgi:hypothetical protein